MTRSMEGWRIEVDAPGEGCGEGQHHRSLLRREYAEYVHDGMAYTTKVWLFILAPICVDIARDRWPHEIVGAYVDLQRETIHVSRELTATEADTLRRLMAEATPAIAEGHASDR